jgi:hypothetical protein
MPRVAVSDWNGTLVEYPDEKPILEYVGLEMLVRSLPFFLVKKLLKGKKDQLEIATEIDESLGSGWRFHPMNALELNNAKSELNALYKDGKGGDDFEFAEEMFKIYNDKVIVGVPPEYIHESIKRFATKVSGQKLNRDMLEAFKELDSLGFHVLSKGIYHGISEILDSGGYADLFASVTANPIIYDSAGNVDHIELDIWGDKGKYFLEMFNEGGELQEFFPVECAYIGDGPGDWGCFDEAGLRILSPYATGENRCRFEKKYCTGQPTKALILEPDGKNNKREIELFLNKA